MAADAGVSELLAILLDNLITLGDLALQLKRRLGSNGHREALAKIVCGFELCDD